MKRADSGSLVTVSFFRNSSQQQLEDLMKDCYHIKTSKALIGYLKKHSRDAIIDFDYQLQTNYGFVYQLKNGEVIFIPNDLKSDAILFESKKCFDEIIKKDQFPIPNPGKDMFDIEGERMRTFHLQAEYYKDHLNKVLKFNFKEITKESVQTYLSKVIGRKIKKLTTPTDIVALISVIGELVKRETSGKWILEKRYGMYNPIYEPNIVTSDGNLISISFNVMGLVKWRVAKLDTIFIHIHSKLTAPIKFDKYSKGRRIIMLE